MLPRTFFLLWCLGAALAQAQPPAMSASISGVVRSAGNGEPLGEVQVWAGRTGQQEKETKSDAQGRYTLSGFEPGQYRVTAMAKSTTGGIGAYMTRIVAVTAGRDVTSVDFNMNVRGSISGTVVDQNKEPLPGMTVLLVAREYTLGELKYVFAGAATTDDRGQYTLTVPPGRAYLVLAQKRPRTLGAISEAPVNPKLRKPAFTTTYYPDSLSIEGAQPLVLRAGEQREAIDIRLQRTPSYCIEGVLEDSKGPAELRFQIAEDQPTSGASGDGAFYIITPGGTTGADGKFRVCDLHPGSYELTVHSANPTGAPSFYGSTTVTLVDKDLAEVVAPARPNVTVPVEVALAGARPDIPDSAAVTVILRPVARGPWMGEKLDDKIFIPGQSAFKNMLVDNYSVTVRNIPVGFYLQDVTYAGRSIRYEPLRLGSAIGEATLRIVLATGGGKVSARVAAKDEEPVPDSRVLLWPAAIGSEAPLAEAMVTGQTDQAGSWSSTDLAPAKYFAIATPIPVDRSPESIAALWRARDRAAEIEITSGATVPLKLAPVSIR